MKKLFKKKSFVETHVYKISRYGFSSGSYSVRFRRKYTPFWINIDTLTRKMNTNYADLEDVERLGYSSMEKANKALKAFLRNVAKVENGNATNTKIQKGSLEEYVVTELI